MNLQKWLARVVSIELLMWQLHMQRVVHTIINIWLRCPIWCIGLHVYCSCNFNLSLSSQLFLCSWLNLWLLQGNRIYQKRNLRCIFQGSIPINVPVTWLCFWKLTSASNHQNIWCNVGYNTIHLCSQYIYYLPPLVPGWYLTCDTAFRPVSMVMKITITQW